ncbi:hypothetical protein SAMN02745221_00461 [Thermosyntropha lipolytica DSM 11003]|uniref:Uncharacterized protein n=1 Tax=Thermosyntropha lipolytica DSM 11003 TaxID=1123382 RepID=A0A1M5KT19_9FIRM|nr:hypothetical protein [Thermosyntropha lipolytica]SHG55944.1 hypothetical protein SAMN02745221_00461 [Thermosyntropha lipolytica DSM 11003]
MVNLRGFIYLLLTLVLVFLLSSSGCSTDFSGLDMKKKPKQELIKVQIVFTDDQSIVGYVKSLGIEEHGKVYVGGSSLNYLYDKNGNIIGSYNYQRVLYIKILPEKEGQE